MSNMAYNHPDSVTGTNDILETLTVPVRARSERSPRSLRFEPLEVVEDVDWFVARRDEVAAARGVDMSERWRRRGRGGLDSESVSLRL